MATQGPGDSPTPRKSSSGLGSSHAVSPLHQRYDIIRQPFEMSPWLGKDENRRDRSLTIKRGPDGQHAKIEAPVPLATARFANRLAVTNDLDSLSKVCGPTQQ